MNYSQFHNAICESIVGTKVYNQVFYYGHMLMETDQGIVVDNAETEYQTIEEAKEAIKYYSILDEVHQDLYKELATETIVEIIRKYHGNIKVTDTLIESYIELASSKMFTVDEVAQDIRKSNKLDRLIENRLDYTLDDGTTIVISEDTQKNINRTFGEYPDVIEYMRESKENFLKVLKQLEE